MQNNQQRLFLLLILAGIIYFLYTKWDAYKNPPIENAQTEQVASVSNSSSNQSSNVVPTIGSSANDGQASMDIGEFITVETDLYKIKIAKHGGDIVEAGLLKYPESLDEPDKPFKILDSTKSRYQVTRAGLSSQSHPTTPNHLNAVYTSSTDHYKMADESNSLIVPLTFTDSETGLTVVKTYEFTRDHYTVGFSQELINNTNDVWVGGEYIEIATKKPHNPKGSAIGASSFDGSVFSLPYNDFKYEKLAYDKMALIKRGLNANGVEDVMAVPKVFPEGNEPGKAGWIAMIQQYFVVASVPGKNKEATDHSQSVIETLQYGKSSDISQNTYGIRMRDYAPIEVKPGESYQFENRYFIGPKLTDQLEETADYLDLTVDYGWFSPISKLMLVILKFFHSFIGNWGWSIILLTLTVKLALFYFANKGYTSMAKMRAVAPKLALIKEEYGDNRQKQSEEMMKLYRKEKINPLGGCWPIIIQIPVFIALFWMLMESVELRQAPWILWIKDLSLRDPYFILPVIMGVTMFFQQRLNPAPTDPMQQKVMKWLPVVFTFMFMWFAAGIVLYWITNNLLTILQQSFIMRRVERDINKHNHN